MNFLRVRVFTESNNDKKTNEVQSQGRKKSWQNSILFESVWLNWNVEQVYLDRFASVSYKNTVLPVFAF